MGLIFVLALLLRVWNLSNVPEAIDEDEMALGYYGYSLLVNQSDEYGNKFPLYFESAGDYKYGLYSYFAAIPVGLLGLNPFSTRIIAALAGSLSVIAIYYLALEIFNKRKYALLAAFVLAVAPTHIHFSRVAYNNVLGALFAITSIFFLIRWLKKESNKKAVFALLFYLLAILSYQAYRIYMPLV
ncbi:MAG: glycosyltransferase family 39 protein, partial [Dehalococcoidia bacterium]